MRFELEGEFDPDPNYLDSLSNFLLTITRFTACDAYSQCFNNLIIDNSIIHLAMYCVLYTPTDAIREKADLSRICLMSIGAHNTHAAAVESFLTENGPKYQAEKLKAIIRDGTINPGSLVDYMVFLDYLSAKYPAQVTLPPDLWKCFTSALRHLIDSDGVRYDVKLFIIHHANVCLKYGLTDQSAKAQLSKMFSRHDLALLIADVALAIATIWFPRSISELRRSSLLCCFPKRSSRKILAVFGEPTIFLVKWFIDRLKHCGIRDLLAGAFKPLWHKTLQHMRDLEYRKHPGAFAVIKIWSELGDRISINLLMDPLVGCSWVGCRFFVQASDGNDTDTSRLLCSGCTFAQYCNATCQRRDWKRNTKNCAPKIPKLNDIHRAPRACHGYYPNDSMCSLRRHRSPRMTVDRN